MRKSTFLKKFNAVVLALCLTATLAQGTLLTASAEGDEQLDYVPDGYVGVYTAADLNNVRNNLSGKYILMQDITFGEDDFKENGAWFNGGYGWIPIGYTAAADNGFSGDFDGNGHIITGLCAYGDDRANYGLGMFSKNSGTIRNLALNGGVSYAWKSSWTGGICAENSGQITDCLNGNTIIGYIGMGGITGLNSGNIDGCYNIGTIFLNDETTAEYMPIGGICGRSVAGVIERCANMGALYCDATAIKKPSISAGGICGEISIRPNSGVTSLTIRQSYNYGYIYAAANSGSLLVSGIVSMAPFYFTHIEDCFNIGTVVAQPNQSAAEAAGISSEFAGTMVRCYNVGAVSAGESQYSKLGSVVCHPNSTAAFENCYYMPQEGIAAADGSEGSCTALTEKQMMDPAAFVGFDFDTVWTMEGCAAYEFPELRDTPMFLYFLGDVNLDGVIDSIDLLDLQQYLLSVGDIQNINAADIDKDSSITSNDLLMLQQHLTGVSVIGADAE